MRTTLLVEKNDQLQRFFSINLYTWVGCEVQPFHSAQLALEKIQDPNSQIDLIITKNSIGTEQTAKAMTEYLKSHNISIPVIVIGDDKETIEEAIHIPSALDIKKLIKTSANALNVTAKDMADLEVPEFFPIPLQFFHCLKYSIVDVYVDNLDNDTHEVVFNTFDEFDSKTVSGFASEGRYELFVKKEDRLKFVTNLTQEIVSDIEMKDLNSNEQISAMEMGQKLLHQKLTRSGITEETVKLSQKNLKNMI